MDPYGDEYSEEEVTRQIVAQLVELERIASSLRMIDFAIVAIGHAAHAMRESRTINPEDINVMRTFVERLRETKATLEQLRWQVHEHLGAVSYGYERTASKLSAVFELQCIV